MADETLRDALTAGFEGADTASPDGSAADPSASAPDGGADAPLSPPQHWNETDRTLFGKAPREIQQRWLSREQEVQQGFTRHGQELAQYKRDREAFDEIFGPLDQQLKLGGLDRPGYIKQLVAWNDYLMKDPQAALRDMAQRFGVDLKALTDAPGADPQISGVLQRFDALQQRLDAQERASRDEQMRQNLDRVQRFAEAKGADGKPSHPYFDDVAEDIIRLMKAGERDLESAYQKALRMNDQVWEKYQAERSAATAAKRDAERKAQVERARRAAAGTNGEGNGATVPKSLREDLEAAFSSWPH